MKISQIISATKIDVNWSNWGNTKPKKADFPMTSKRSGVFPLTRKWRWATISFCALSKEFVVMTAYHVDLPEFQAVLAERLPNDTRTLARYEYHANHPVLGWHIHGVCGDVDGLTPGITKPAGQKRIPTVHNRHRRSEFAWGEDSMGDTLALKIAAIRYGIPYQEDLLGNLVK
jgi:hypothetical protein